MIPRYTRPEMGRIWTPERRYRIWLDVELAACEAMVRLGGVPPEDFDALRRAFDGYQFTAADVARIEEIERTVKHDVIAFLTFVEEKGGPAARHLHKGMTSSDVLDTTLAVQLAEATALLLAGVDRVMAAVKKRALEHARTPMMGRSHGIHAEPITFGLKLAGWYDAWARRREAIARAGRTAAVGKISGAVGTFANVDPRVVRVVDIKTPGSKESERNRLENLPDLRATDQLKFVICDRADYDWSRRFIAEHGLVGRCPILFSPSHEQLKAVDLANWILEDHLPVRLQIQLHKYLWGNVPGK